MQRTRLIFVGFILFALVQLLGHLLLLWAPHLVVLNDTALFGAIQMPQAVTAILIIGLLLLWKVLHSNHMHHPFMHWGEMLIVVGALSNIIDRLIYGAVVDYIPFLGFSTFNLADVAIVIGAVLLAFEPKKAK